MSALAKAVRRMNFTEATSPGAFRIGQKVLGMIGRSELFALPRWGIAAGLTVYWLVEPDFSRFRADPDADAVPE